MKKILVLVLATMLAGCGASQYLGNTKASVGGPTGFSYESNKNQEGLDATGELGPNGVVRFSVKTTAYTPEAAIAAALASNVRLLGLLEAALAAGAASKGGSSVPTTIPQPGFIVPTPGK